jgi:antitoxin HicB
MRYPVVFTEDSAGVIVDVPDVPGVLTHGDDKADALAMALDGLLTMFAHYMELGRDIPQPSQPKQGQPIIMVPAMPAVKLALYQAMREKRLSQSLLAEQLRIDARAVRRLLDLDHDSSWRHLERALAVLGLRVEVEVSKAA